MASFFESAAKGNGSQVVGDGRNRWATVHRDDVADLYLRLVEQAASGSLDQIQAGDRIFHATDGTSERVGDIASAASAAEGEAGQISLWPLEEARSALGKFADTLVLDQVVTSPRSESLLGWKPRYRGFVRNSVEAFNDWARPI
jgi:nucleoside-diphosphate-sugar epimerase